MAQAMNGVPINPTRPAVDNLIEREVSNLRQAVAAVQGIRIRARYELQQAVKTRIESERYLKDAQAKANSYAQQLLLGARRTVKKEIEDIKLKARKGIEEITLNAIEELKEEKKEIGRKALETLQQEMDDFRQKLDEELGKAMADIRVIRITAREELQVQRKLAGAAKIQALSFESQEPDEQTFARSKQTAEV
ncbi:hypothetical protein ACFLXH_04890 [Chloroflexota bacterium]